MSSTSPPCYSSTKDTLRYVDTSAVTGAPFVDNKVISLFSGAGGLDLGLERAGFNTIACVEIDADCRATLRHNRPEWALVEDAHNGRIPGDIRSVTADEILTLTGLKRGEAALVTGGAPCQSFSNIGKRDGINSQTNGTLFLDFLRIVEGILPKAVLFENVVGLTQAKHRPIVDELYGRLESAGYRVTSAILNAANYGVAQRRERFFLIGIRTAEQPALPLPTHYQSRLSWLNFARTLDSLPDYTPKRWLSVKDAFKKIPAKSFERCDYVLMNISPPVQHRMSYIEQGQNFHVLPLDQRPNCWKNGLHQGTDTFGRLKFNEPSVTIRTAAYNPAKGRYIHPLEDRGLSSHEMAALQGFPYTWVFRCDWRDTVTLISAGRQIGNAVPPPLAEALGKAIRCQIAGRVSTARHISSAWSSEFTLNASSTAACGVL